MPVAPTDERSLPTPFFEPPAPEVDAAARAQPPEWRVMRDHGLGQVEARTSSRRAGRVDDYALQETETEATAIVSEREPSRASMTGRQTVRFRWPGRTVELRSRGQIESDATTFHVSLHAEITLDGLPHFSRRWLASFRRHLL
jgi:hypothetical protein